MLRLRETTETSAFRREVRSFIDANLPDHIRARMRLGRPPEREDVVTWQRILNRRGWATPAWPVEHGGPGWGPRQRLIFQEEIHGAPAPEPLVFNVNLVGPVLIRYGSDAQKRYFLPRIANLDIAFCQGFSEPGAGSDLAALRTTAPRQGAGYVVQGEKTWTTAAHLSDWMFALVRTDPAVARPQLGISFLLIDMRSPGIHVRPIRTIDGDHHVNSVFLDNVVVPAENLVGEENRGWDYAKFLLGNERIGIGRVGRVRERLSRARQLAGTVREAGRPLLDDPVMRERIALLEAEATALAATELRVVAAVAADPDSRPDARSSIIKMRGAELHQASCELLADIAGPFGLPADSPTGTNTQDWALPLAPSYLHSRAATIYGGSTEVQKNILAKTVLGL